MQILCIFYFLELCAFMALTISHAGLLDEDDDVGWLRSMQAKQEWQNAFAVDLKEVKGLLYLLTHLSPWMCLDLGEFEFSVVGVHLTDLLSGWGAENLKHTGGTISPSNITSNLKLYLFGNIGILSVSTVITLMISTNWSTPLSPGKIGCPRSSSASTQPADHTSKGQGRSPIVKAEEEQ